MNYKILEKEFTKHNGKGDKARNCYLDKQQKLN